VETHKIARMIVREFMKLHYEANARADPRPSRERTKSANERAEVRHERTRLKKISLNPAKTGIVVSSMPDWITIHQPVLINTVGHSVGAVVFGTLLYFLWLNRNRSGQDRRPLPLAAASLALLWNVGSLVALAAGTSDIAAVNATVAVSFSVLSLLPAVLLHIFLGPRRSTLSRAGYVLSALATLLHLADWLTGQPQLHTAAISLVIVGFGALTVLSAALDFRQHNRAAARLAGTMGLFFLAISFSHFGGDHSHQNWSLEFALHHASLPLALFVLLQDYRFLLLDAFLRLIVNGALAAGLLLGCLGFAQSAWFHGWMGDPFRAGILFVMACVVLSFYVELRIRAQQFLTRVIFLRTDEEAVTLEIQQLRADAPAAYLQEASKRVAAFMSTTQHEVTENNESPPWAQARLPMQFSQGQPAHILLGPREGGRRYLSEDYAILARLTSRIVEQVERRQAIQMQELVSQAELRALQSQINPHFLFNSLNTLYGTIHRDNTEARQLVLNLSEVFRYLLQSERTFVAIEEEIKIVKAYLAIEAQRLGPKLQIHFDVEDSTLQTPIPLLAIQPLVENAVRHGVANKTGTGFIKLSASMSPDGVSIRISNSGELDPRAIASSSGIGLANVRKRLALCYGPDANFCIDNHAGVTTASFLLPAQMEVCR